MSYEIKAGVTRQVTMTSGLGPTTYSAVDSAQSPSTSLAVDSSTGVTSVIGNPSTQPPDQYVVGTAGGAQVGTVAFTIVVGSAPIVDSSPATVVVGPAMAPATLTIDAATPGMLFVSWTNADITTPVAVPPDGVPTGTNPSGLILWDEDAGTEYAFLEFVASGTHAVDTWNSGFNGSKNLTLRSQVSYR
jgi:hypothetical protein